MSNFHSSMSKAPRDGRELLLLVCTGETETPIAREVGWWDHELKRWEGDWRYYSGEGGYAASKPIGWAPLPEIDQSFLNLVAPKPKAKKPPPPALPKPAAVEARQKAVNSLTAKAAAAAKPAKKAAAPPSVRSGCGEGDTSDALANQS